MNRDQLGAIRKSRFNLNVGNHLGDALHHIGAGEDGAAFAHELGHGLAVARTFHDGGADHCHGFGVIELEATGAAALGQQAGGEDQ